MLEAHTRAHTHTAVRGSVRQSENAVLLQDCVSSHLQLELRVLHLFSLSGRNASRGLSLKQCCLIKTTESKRSKCFTAHQRIINLIWLLNIQIGMMTNHFLSSSLSAVVMDEYMNASAPLLFIHSHEVSWYFMSLWCLKRLRSVCLWPLTCWPLTPLHTADVAFSSSDRREDEVSWSVLLWAALHDDATLTVVTSSEHEYRRLLGCFGWLLVCC